MGSIIKPGEVLLKTVLPGSIAGGKTPHGITGKEAQQNQASPLPTLAQVKVPAPAGVPPAPTPLAGAEIFKAAAAALGLPQDALSNALLSFTRFFSITPETTLLTNLRKEVLMSGSSSPKTAKEKAAMESRALAASAAFDKGVSLSKECLDEYAAVPGGSDFSGDQKRRKNDSFNQKEEPKADDVKKLFEDSGQMEGEKHFLDFMNRIPGKNGQRWIVWPFNYCSGDTELSVLVRILIKEPVNQQSRAKNAGGLILADIAGPKRKWHFIFDKNGEGKLTVNLYVFPGFPNGELKSLQLEMDRTFKHLAPQTEFHIQNDEEPPFPATELDGGTLLTVNEEV
jgi:hypothetical protein